ncbi:MAG: glycosyltransferase family 9 protein [Flavobacteriaceae bacterium]
MASTQKPIQHILVIRLSAMGDVAMSVPVVLALLKANPKVKITILTREFFTPFFKELPNVSVVSPDLKGKHKGIIGLWRLAKELKSLHIEAVADLHDVLRSNIVVRFLRLMGVPYKQIDKGRSEKKALTASENKKFEPLLSTHQRYAQVFDKLGFSLHLSQHSVLPVIPMPSAIQDVTVSGKKLIGMAPFAAHKGKMYPLEQMSEVVKVLSDTYQVILFGGGAEEQQQLDVIATNTNNVFNATGKFSFTDELALISNLDLMVSMDSGNGHLAAMYGVEVVTIWGVTHPYAGFTPFGQPEQNQITPDRTRFPLIPTSIYGNKYPKGYLDCFETISVASVIKLIQKRLNNN